MYLQIPPQESEIIGILILKYWRNWNGGLLTNQRWCYLLFLVIILRFHTFSPKKELFVLQNCAKKHFSQIFNVFFPFISFTLVAKFNISCTLLWPFYPSKKGKSKATPPKRNKVLHLGNLSQAKVETIVLTFQNTLDKLRKALLILPLKLKVFPKCTIHHSSN